MKIGAVVLAAGGSSRLGQPKQLLLYQGQTLVRRAAEAALGAGCAPVAVVVGSERKKIAESLHDLEVMILLNESWRRGIGTSIRTGTDALKGCDALVILTCDQPRVGSTLIRHLAQRHQETQKPMVASAYAGTFGVPVLFARECFENLRSLGEKEGAKTLLTAQPDQVARVDFPEGAIDIDTPADYQALLD